MKSGKRVRISPETLRFASDHAKATLFRSAGDTDRAIIIATGFGAVPELYFGLAEELAHLGFHALVPDIISPLPGENPEATIAFKADRIANSVDALGHEVGISHLELVGHSFGGVCVMEALQKLSQLDGIHLVSSVGFGGIINEGGGIKVRQVPGFYVSEVVGATRHLNRFLGAAALKAEIGVMADIRQRLHEIHDIQSIPSDYMAKHLGLTGVKERVYVADRDHVIDPGPTKRAVPNAVSIHPHATHFAPTTHGPHVAHLIAA